MNKEFKEIEAVMERLRDFKNIKIMYGNTFAMHIEQLEQLQKDIKYALNYIDNSISKEVIEKKIEELQKEIDEIEEKPRLCELDSKHIFKINENKDKIQVLQELLEGK